MADSDEVRVTYRPLGDLARWPRNPKAHDLPKLKESIRRFGFVLPLVEDARTSQLVAGHGRLEALLQMQAEGEPTPRRVKVQASGGWLVPVVSGVEFDSEQEAEAYLLADNRISEVGGWDHRELAALLHDAEGGLAGTGFVEADLAVYAPLLSEAPPEGVRFDDPVEHWKGMPEYEQGAIKAAKTLIVHFATDAAYEEFKKVVGQEGLTDRTRSTWYPHVDDISTDGVQYQDDEP